MRAHLRRSRSQLCHGLCVQVGDPIGVKHRLNAVGSKGDLLGSFHETWWTEPTRRGAGHCIVARAVVPKILKSMRIGADTDRDTMNSTFSTALSGLSAAMLRLDAAGSNITNSQTPGYRPQSVSQTEPAEGGVSASVERVVEPDNNLAQDIVDQMSASYSFKANLRVVKTQDEMLGTLLDLRA